MNSWDIQLLMQIPLPSVRSSTSLKVVMITIGEMMKLCSVVFADFTSSGDQRSNLPCQLPTQPFPLVCHPSLHLNLHQAIMMKVPVRKMDEAATMEMVVVIATQMVLVLNMVVMMIVLAMMMMMTVTMMILIRPMMLPTVFILIVPSQLILSASAIPNSGNTSVVRSFCVGYLTTGIA